MKATFTKAIRYIVDIVCESPLRTGSSAKDTQSILRDAARLPFLQGTSLAGAFRSWREDADLFADTNHKSALMFSDLRLEDVTPVLRPRLRINGATGTAASNAKFDMAAVPAGTHGSFQLVWTGDSDPAKMAEKIEAYLSALNSGEITLGALKANGFGRLSVSAKRRIYDMSNPGDLEAWLLGSEVTDTEPVSLSERMEQNVLFTVTATVPSILIKASGGNRSQGGAHFIQMREAGRAIAPGSSLKGIIRSQMARICPHFHRRPEELEQLFGHENRRDVGGTAGVLRFSDGILTDEKALRTYRIRINRLTGGVMSTGMFTEEPVTASLKFEIRIPAERRAGCALLLYALRDLGLGLYELGSGTAVGRGRLEAVQVQISGPDSDAQLCCTKDGVELSDPDGLIARWEQALKERGRL